MKIETIQKRITKLESRLAWFDQKRQQMTDGEGRIRNKLQRLFNQRDRVLTKPLIRSVL